MSFFSSPPFPRSSSSSSLRPLFDRLLFYAYTNARRKPHYFEHLSSIVRPRSTRCLRVQSSVLHAFAIDGSTCSSLNEIS